MIVAIHQPNYFPWLGYFHKIARCEVFVFLDDAQFSKGSYTNRVTVADADQPRWLTQPISGKSGDKIADMVPSKRGWTAAHLSSLRNFYRKASYLRPTLNLIEEMFASIDEDANIAATNSTLIRGVASTLGLACDFRLSSKYPANGLMADDRLVQLVQAIDPSGSYLSGRGGAKYQDPEKFSRAGLGFVYTDFVHPEYARNGQPFIAGLSILDPLFHLGVDGTRALLVTPGGTP